MPSRPLQFPTRALGKSAALWTTRINYLNTSYISAEAFSSSLHPNALLVSPSFSDHITTTSKTSVLDSASGSDLDVIVSSEELEKITQTFLEITAMQRLLQEQPSLAEWIEDTVRLGKAHSEWYVFFHPFKF